MGTNPSDNNHISSPMIEDKEYILPDYIKPGGKIRWIRMEIVRDGVRISWVTKLVHILAIIDEDQVVYKVWSSKRQSWIYDIEDANYLAYLAEKGTIVNALTTQTNPGT
jgi:hypothetical protein